MIFAMTDRTSDGRSKLAIGQRLDLTRLALGLSQVDFCRRAGIAPNTFNQYKSGKNRPVLDEAYEICDAFNLTLDWIYFGDPSGLRYELASAIAALRKLAETTPTPAAPRRRRQKRTPQ